LFVELDGIHVEGLVHITNLSKDYYRFDQAAQTLTGERSGMLFELGDAITVQVASVNLEDRKIDFVAVEQKVKTTVRGKRKDKKDSSAQEVSDSGTAKTTRSSTIVAEPHKPSDKKKPAKGSAEKRRQDKRRKKQERRDEKRRAMKEAKRLEAIRAESSTGSDDAPKDSSSTGNVSSDTVTRKTPTRKKGHKKIDQTVGAKKIAKIGAKKTSKKADQRVSKKSASKLRSGTTKKVAKKVTQTQSKKVAKNASVTERKVRKKAALGVAKKSEIEKKRLERCPRR